MTMSDTTKSGIVLPAKDAGRFITEPPRITDDEAWLRLYCANQNLPDSSEAIAKYTDDCLAAFRERFPNPN